MYERKQFTAEPLQGDRRAICLYEGDTHVPYVLRKRLSAQDIEQFRPTGNVGDILVTFAGQVPLEIVMSGASAVSEFISETWFETPGVSLCSSEFRAIGSSFDDYDHPESGYVHIQVTCSLDF